MSARIVNKHNLETVPTVTKRHAQRFFDSMSANKSGAAMDALEASGLVSFPDDPPGWTGDMTPEQDEAVAIEEAILERFEQKVRDSGALIAAANEVLDEYRAAGNGKVVQP